MSAQVSSGQAEVAVVDDEGSAEREGGQQADLGGRLWRIDGGPNPVVLEAQGKICTGPTQTRPLDEAQMRKVLEAVLASARGELPREERVSLAQMGALFGGMTLRATSFPPETQWSDGERAALHDAWPDLCRCLPQEVLFLADPEGSVFGGLSPVGPMYTGNGGRADRRLVGTLREVLAGGHVGYEECMGLLREVLAPGGLTYMPETREAGEEGQRASEALVAALLICQRMNGETDRELKAYCFAFDDDLGPPPKADVRSLTHYGEPYDGSTRFMRTTLFVAAVRACYGEASLMHGAPWMPPKGGVTEEQMLQFLGAGTRLSPKAAAALMEDEEVGFAHISQREARPSLHELTDMRLHLKKRPAFATTEKVQRFVETKKGREAMVAGFYHTGYEEPLLMLMRRRGVEAGLVIKGEEGGMSLTAMPTVGERSKKGPPVNYCSGFRPMAVPPLQNEVVRREAFSTCVSAVDFGILPSPSPRHGNKVEASVKFGMEALQGTRGAAYDRIVLNAAMHDHLLGCVGAKDPLRAIERARQAIDSGAALKRLQAYIRKSRMSAV